MGYSLKVLLLNEDLKKYDLYITPWLGVGVVLVFLYPMSWMGFSVRAVAHYFAACVAAINFAVWHKYREPARVEMKEVVIIAVVGLIVGGIYGGVLAMRDYESYSFSVAKDFGTYLVNSKAVLESSLQYIKTLPEGIPHIESINRSMNFYTRGGVFVNALFSALYGVDLARIVYAVSAFIMFLSIIAFRPFLRKEGHIVVILPILCILPFNSFYQYLVIWGWHGQLYSFGLIALAFYIEYYLTEVERFDIRTCVLLVFVLSTNSFAYLESMAYPLLPAVAFLLVMPFNQRYRRKSLFCNVVVSGGLFTVVNFYFLIKLVNVFLFLDFNPPAWAMPLVTLADVAGVMYSFTNLEAALVSLLIANALMLPVIIWQLRKEGVLSFITGSCVIFFLLHLFFCLRYFGIGEITSYNVFKSALSLSFILVIVTARFLEGSLPALSDMALPLKGAARKRLMTAVVFCLLFCLNVMGTWNGVTVFYRAKSLDTAITKDSFVVKYFADSPAYAASDFIINTNLLLDQLTAAYFAPAGRAYGIGQDDKGRMIKKSLKAGDLYIVDSYYDFSHKTTDARKLVENDKYSVYQLDEDSVVMADYGGFEIFVRYANIGGNRELIRPLMENTANLYFYAIKGKPVDFRAVFFNGQGGEERSLGVKMYVNDELAYERRFSEEFMQIGLDGVDFQDGVNYITFEFDGDVSNTSLMKLDIR
jgi:hypothetical protein